MTDNKQTDTSRFGIEHELAAQAQATGSRLHWEMDLFWIDLFPLNLQ